MKVKLLGAVLPQSPAEFWGSRNLAFPILGVTQRWLLVGLSTGPEFSTECLRLLWLQYSGVSFENNCVAPSQCQTVLGKILAAFCYWLEELPSLQSLTACSKCGKSTTAFQLLMGRFSFMLFNLCSVLLMRTSQRIYTITFSWLMTPMESVSHCQLNVFRTIQNQYIL